MMASQEVQEAKERIRALRAQIRSENTQRATATAEADDQVRLAALTTEERELERQLSEVRSLAVPGKTEEPVNNAATSEPVTEGTAFMETVDQAGNLVRVPVNQDTQVELTDEGRSAGGPPEAVPAEAPNADPADVGTREADAPPPDASEDATMGRNKRR
jgi:hypothetical protein